jgi:hypothetical protein
MLRAFLAVIVGAIAGMLTIMIVESVSDMLFPAGVDLNQPGARALYMDSVPLAAKLFVLIGWAAGSYLGARIATRMAHSKRLVPGFAVAGVMLLAGVFNMALLPHPLWMWAAGIAALTLPAYYVARRLTPKPPRPPMLRDALR